MKILVFVEQRGNKLKKSAFEALATARKLAGASSQVAALVIGGSVEALAGELKNYGADSVYVVNNPNFDKYNVLAYAAAAEQAIKAFAPKLILGIATPMGRDLFPRLAARFDAGIATDLIDIKVQGDFITGLKPMFSGKCFAELALQNTELQFATLRPNVFKGEASGDGAATVNKLEVNLPASSFQTLEIRKGKSEKVDLTEATLIISGGRSLGSADAFKILNDCADVIGATVGASRAAVDAGYAGHEMQVGQTGKTVNPNLYIAAGISGSIQHMAGMRSSKVIVAINTDPEAPIFKIANYGIVADLFQVVPAMTKAFKELKG